MLVPVKKKKPREYSGKQAHFPLGLLLSFPLPLPFLVVDLRFFLSGSELPGIAFLPGCGFPRLYIDNGTITK